MPRSRCCSVALPSLKPTERRGIYDRTTGGARLCLATSRLRGLLALKFAVAAASAMVIVNPAVILLSVLDLGRSEIALALGAYGAGSMIAALSLPRMLETSPDRPVMVAGPTLLPLGLAAGAAVGSYPALLTLWFVLALEPR